MKCKSFCKQRWHQPNKKKLAISGYAAGQLSRQKASMPRANQALWWHHKLSSANSLATAVDVISAMRTPAKSLEGWSKMKWSQTFANTIHCCSNEWHNGAQRFGMKTPPAVGSPIIAKMSLVEVEHRWNQVAELHHFQHPTTVQNPAWPLWSREWMIDGACLRRPPRHTLRNTFWVEEKRPWIMELCSTQQWPQTEKRGSYRRLERESQGHHWSGWPEVDATHWMADLVKSSQETPCVLSLFLHCT